MAEPKQKEKKTVEKRVQAPAPPAPEPAPKAELIEVAPRRPEAPSIFEVEHKAEPKNPSLEGVYCINHPWRPAHATCDYCARPFCYADIVTYNSKTYCLEDIDKVSRLPANEPSTTNSWVFIAGAIFILSGLFLGYSLYEQLVYVGNYAATSGVGTLLNGLVFDYTLTLLNAIAIVFCIVSGIVIMRNTHRGFIFSGVVLGLSLILFSYEYLNSNAQYLFVLIAAMILNMVIIASGRMNLLGLRHVEETYTPTVDWPRPEVF